MLNIMVLNGLFYSNKIQNKKKIIEKKKNFFL